MEQVVARAGDELAEASPDDIPRSAVATFGDETVERR
jgi:hypothetical protein